MPSWGWIRVCNWCRKPAATPDLRRNCALVLMYYAIPPAMLATMSQHAEMPSPTWSELGLTELLPTGTVTLLLADVEGSTGLWESQP